jgi:hypothetical protein
MTTELTIALWCAETTLFSSTSFRHCQKFGAKESALFERETQADLILTIFVWRRVCSSRLFKHLLLLPRRDDSLVALTKTGDLTRKDRIVRICGEKQGVSGRYFENTGQLFC